MREHGGDIDSAKARFGAGDWIDLSTGINRVAFPVPPLPMQSWTALPTRTQIESLHAQASVTYGSTAPIFATAGAQAAIQLIPQLSVPGVARVLSPTYSEHAAALHNAGWRVEEVLNVDDLAGADLAVVVNPNNPDGRVSAPEKLLSLMNNVGRLVVDESFADATPALSLCPHAGRAGLLVLRSLGKFYGLAGVRLGFVLGCQSDIAEVARLAGPWNISGVAIAIGQAALADTVWREATVSRLAKEAPRLDALAVEAGWQVLGGTALFRLYGVHDSADVRDGLARHRIWSRVFSSSPQWLRLGLPGNEAEWQRLKEALRDLPKS